MILEAFRVDLREDSALKVCITSRASPGIPASVLPALIKLLI